MPRYELTISPNYVKSWGVSEAIRELLQNGFDEESINPDNTFLIDISIDTLSLSNKSSVLTKSSLLLGNTSKSNDKTIGSFGEGYKLALLVLLRLNYNVVIYNYALKETWTPKIIKSRRYDSDLLVIDVSKSLFKKADNNLTVTIKGLLPSDLDTIKSCTLQLQPDFDYITSEMGKILSEHSHKGKLFVGGLFVCFNDKLHYGYDFKPEYLKVDRDRRLVSDFEIFWQTSKMWESTNLATEQLKLLEANADDVMYLDNTSVASRMATKFYRQYGKDAVPVTSQSAYDSHKAAFNCTPIFVHDVKAKILRSSDVFIPPMVKSTNTPTEVLKRFFDTFGYELSVSGRKYFGAILEKSKGWSGR